MFLATFETLAKQKIQQVVSDLPGQMEVFGGQNSKETVASSVSPKFRQLPGERLLLISGWVVEVVE